MEYNKTKIKDNTFLETNKTEFIGTKLDKHCLSCKHFNKEAVKNCDDTNCLFWEVRPYQTK